ncbi:IS1 family transposase [Parapedobacter sp. 10938]|uniref:IS1 family transposase n=1 Tax=Parapedobacter flavus TaxID=3110225 RepID=UPI002DBC8FD4|nr:IS1 family transposase [Parapedobacter sp. 10938]MEC3880219.1 IS1 family transposase [Parapedobacter sp. 10938]
MNINPACKNCNTPSIKYGTINNKQRYRCKQCHKTFVKEYSYPAYTIQNHQIKTLLVEGCGMRSIARILHIAVSTVLRRIINLAASISKPILSYHKEYEMDEMCTYIQKKNRQYWIAYAIRKDTKEVADFTVGKRTNKTLQQVTSTLLFAEAKNIHTDRLPSYNRLIPSEIHHNRKNGTNHIERKNLTLRTHLKRLGRRTICFSKTLHMLIACLKLYFWS